jgi:uncharacterized protein (DUF2132 family)
MIINCFNFDPSVKSSLKFSVAPWRRQKVSDLYLTPSAGSTGNRPPHEECQANRRMNAEPKSSILRETIVTRRAVVSFLGAVIVCWWFAPPTAEARFGR